MNSSKECLISIVIPIYNREATLRRCVESVLNAGYKNLEVVLVDDGSTDHSWDVICSFSDERIKSIHIANGGISAARNVGIGLSSGEYIHFVDSDDYIEESIYDQCVDVINDCAPDVILFDYIVYFDSAKEHYERRFEAIPNNVLLDRNYIRENLLPVMVNIDDRKELFIDSFVWNKLFKRDIIDQNQILFDVGRRRWEDRLFVVSFLKAANVFYYIATRGYYYVMGHSFFAKSYDKVVFEIVLKGSEDYARIVGDLYATRTDYSNNYYSRVFIDTALQQFSIPSVNEEVLKKDMIQALIDYKAERMFVSFIPKSKNDEQLKTALLEKKYDLFFDLLKDEFIKQQQKKSKSSLWGIVKNKVSHLIRR